MRSKKIAASILAFSLITSAASSNTEVISKLIPVNTISASAASAYISSGDWKFKIMSDNTADLKKYTGSSNIVNIPESIIDPDTNQSYTVAAISYSAFTECKDRITYVSFPSGIDTIAAFILEDSTNLTQVYIPEGVAEIGENAFANTPNLKSITFPDTLEDIRNSAFKKSGLTSITFPSNLKKIGSYAFDGTKLTTVTLPGTLEFVDFYSFGECQSLLSADINCNCDMGRSIFGRSDYLANVNISSDCLDAVFRSGALGDCPSLKTINGVLILREGADGKPYLYSGSIPYLKKYFVINDESSLSFFNGYIDGMIKYIVKTETAGCTNDYQKVKKLHDWVCNKVDYAYVNSEPDPSLECHVDSSVFIRDTTVCDGYARALTLLLREAGFEAYYLESSYHVWTMVRIGDNYFHVDACHDDGRGYDHYLKSDNDINKCQFGHGGWHIDRPTFRYNYDISYEPPVCQYSYSDINRGDVNLDGDINQNDVELLQRYLLHLECSLPDPDIADVNRDGEVKIQDLIELARKIR